MTRSILCGLLGLLSVVTLGTLPIACQSGGVGDPCTPEDEYKPDFTGFKVTEENIESRSFQCSTRICLVNHFQGRVSCPLGQGGLDAPNSSRKSCAGPGDTSCGEAGTCVEATTLVRDCDPKNGNADCDRFFGADASTCDTTLKLCTCTGSGTTPEGFICDKDKFFRSYACHKKGSCQSDADDAKKNAGKDCCVPGTDQPVAASVCGQCEGSSKRNADQAVYCSCRCGVAVGEPEDPNFNFCSCPAGFTCSEIRPNVGLGDKQITGKYCIKDTTEYKEGSANDCGQVKGYWDPTCKGVPSAL
jgi:hypothetical protein